MAENKESFIMYADLIHTVRKMKKEDAGELLLHILEYVNDENPVTDNFVVELTFEPIKQQFKRDLKKWEKTIDFKSKGGRIGNIKRWHIDLYQEILSKKITLEEAEIIAENRKTQHTDKNNRIASHTDKNNRIASHSIANVAVTVNDTVTVNDNVTVNVNDITSTKVDVVDKEKFDNTNNENFRDILKFESQQWLESVSMQQRKTTFFIKEKLDEFTIFLFTTEKTHPNKKEFISHFINWLPKNLKKNGKEQIAGSNGTKTPYKFDAARIIETNVGKT